jgi:ParB family chromosome partitioning protein
LPELKRIPLADIDEPELPARASMSEVKLADLCESMTAIGLLQPITLKRKDLRYEIEAGHRRFMAARELKWRDIPALVYEPGELAEGAAMLAENIFREDLNAAEEALLFVQSQDRFGLDEAGLVDRFKRSPDYIADRLRLLRGDEQVFDALVHDRINFSVARELNKCEDEGMRRYYLDAAIRGETGARTVAEWVKSWRQQGVLAPAAPAETVPSTVEHEHIDGTPECAFCGGRKDPWNLVSIYVHKWELAEIKRVLQRPTEGEQCESESSGQQTTAS